MLTPAMPPPSALDIRVSVIIPVLNDAARLETCLEALEKQTMVDRFEVIVVDNGSSDAPATVVDEYPRARKIEERRPGAYAARNRGVQEARGSILAFTDSDCIPAPDWLERGCERLDAATVPTFIVGRIDVFARDPLAPSAAEVYELMHGFPQQWYASMSFGVTANLFVRRDVFDRVGHFNPGLKSGGDREWGERAGAQGACAAYAGDASVRHPARASLGELNKKLRRIQSGHTQVRTLPGQSGRRSAMTGVWMFLRNLTPPVRSIARYVPQVRSATRGSRLAYVWIRLAVHYFTFYQRIATTVPGRGRSRPRL